MGRVVKSALFFLAVLLFSISNFRQAVAGISLEELDYVRNHVDTLFKNSGLELNAEKQRKASNSHVSTSAKKSLARPASVPAKKFTEKKAASRDEVLPTPR